MKYINYLLSYKEKKNGVYIQCDDDISAGDVVKIPDYGYSHKPFTVARVWRRKDGTKTAQLRG